MRDAAPLRWSRGGGAGRGRRCPAAGERGDGAGTGAGEGQRSPQGGGGRGPSRRGDATLGAGVEEGRAWGASFHGYF